MDPESAGRRLAEQTAWLELLFLHLAGRNVRGRIEREDLVQEVFLRALSDAAGLPDFTEGETALRRYLAQLARNCVIDVLRCMRAKKRDRVEVPIVRSDWSVSGIADSRVAAVQRGPATLAADREHHESLMAAFETLSAEHRRVIGLRQFEGLNAAETAVRLKRSESAVHSLYRRALQAWSQVR